MQSDAVPDSRLQDPSVIRGYGGLVSEICASVPDGVICFFVSYGQMEETVARWADQGVLDKIRRSKLVFIETKVRQNIYIFFCLIVIFHWNVGCVMCWEVGRWW